MFRHYPPTDLLTELKQWGIKMLSTIQNTSFRSCSCIKKSIEKMIKQACFNTLKNDIFGSTIINYTSLTVNHRKHRGSCLQAIKPRLNRWIWGKNKCILSRVHKTWSFYNLYFSINLSMGKPKVCCRQRETGTFFWQGLVTPLTAQFWLLQISVLVGYSCLFR